MPQITFLPSKKVVDVQRGTELLEAARQAGVDIDSPCGAKGTCGKCIVRILSGDVESDSLGLLPRKVVADGFVLACKTQVLDSPVTVLVPEQIGRKDGKFSDSNEDIHLIPRELLPARWDYDPIAVKWFLDVPEPRLGDGLSDLDRLTRRIQRDWGRREVGYPLSVIRQVAEALRADGGKVTVTLIREPERYRVIGIEPGDRTSRHYGIAVDIGTTTVAVQLIFLPLGKAIGTRSDYNAQIDCGLDVISRINYARKPGHLEELRTRVLGTVNKLIAQLCESHSVAPVEICNAVIAGNTTMTHLLLGLNPEYIRLSPYTPTVLEFPYLRAMDVGIDINPQSFVYISPNVGSYVGGDITAGILCTDLATDSEEVNLFIDIGTNGEIVVGNNTFLMTCACSAGPAFEGGGIEHGMRAAFGAIERVEIERETGQARCQVIGDVKPKGICGSGMISLIANLFTTGWIDAAGKLNRGRRSEYIISQGRVASYVIVPPEESGTGKAITISETDIENLIRAKAAIYSACALMLNEIGMDFTDLANIYIGGGFGKFLDIEKAIIIGLIPDVPREKYHYIGNSALMGAYMVLVSQEYQRKQLELAKKMTYLELNTDPSYMDQYTGALFLPHTDPKRFPSVEAIMEGTLSKV